MDNRFLPDICLQHMIAVMLLDGTVSFKSAHDVARMKDPGILKQRAKVALVHDKDLQKLMPARVAIVEIALADGQMLSQRIEAVRGTVKNPMSHDEIVAKATDLIAPVLAMIRPAKSWLKRCSGWKSWAPSKRCATFAKGLAGTFVWPLAQARALSAPAASPPNRAFHSSTCSSLIFANSTSGVD